MSSHYQLRPDIAAIPLDRALSETSGYTLANCDCPESLMVSGVTVDSNDCEQGWIFVAIGGLTRHGVRYLPQARKNGAVAVMTDERGAKEVTDFPTIVVPDPRLAAAMVAKAIYEPHFKGLRLVGVTGTNGKTTTTHLLRSVLSKTIGATGLMGTTEIDVGDRRMGATRTTAEAPVVYRGLACAKQNGLKAMVLEVSAHAMSLNRLSGIVFDCSVFTNLQHDHLDFYETMERYFGAKALLFNKEYTKKAIVCVDDKWGKKLARQIKGAGDVDLQTVSALQDPSGVQADWQVTSINEAGQRWGVEFDLQTPSGSSQCLCPFPGRVNVQNAALTIACAYALGSPVNEATEALAEAESVPGRVELVRVSDEEGRLPQVIVDYAHTPEALEATLLSLRPRTKGKIILVFGTDGDRDASKREDLAQVAARLADALWITDENPRTEDPQQIRDYLIRGVSKERPSMTDVIEVKTCRRDAVREAIFSADPTDLVAITGKGAEPYQEVSGVFHDYSDTIVATETLKGRLAR